MSNQKNNSSSSGIGVVGLLGIVFVTLKLLGITAVANWSWWWVTLPFWVGIPIFIIGALGAIAYYTLHRK